MRRPVWAALAAVLLLAGCSDGDDPPPKIAPSESTSAASNTAPPPIPSGPVEPTLPPEAEGEDAAAAEAFVRFYWEMADYAQATGDVRAFRDLAAESCGSCVAGSDGIEATYSAGGTIDGGEISVRSVMADQISSHSGKAFSVDVSAEVAKQVVHKPQTAPKRYPGGITDFQFIVRVENAQWTVLRLDVVQ